MSETDIVSQGLAGGVRMVAMVAPSFPVVFPYPGVVSMLRKLGFAAVVEVSAGAEVTNRELVSRLSAGPQFRFITSPCPSFSGLVHSKIPEAIPYLATFAPSPMVATARIVRDEYPGYTPVFIGPCYAKKSEAGTGHPELGIVVLTYTELSALCAQRGISADGTSGADAFDIVGPHTRMYPVDGGLTASAGVKGILKDHEIRVVSGWIHAERAVREFLADTGIRLLDVLFCEGGCIHGPGIRSPLTLTERIRKIREYAHA